MKKEKNVKSNIYKNKLKINRRILPKTTGHKGGSRHKN